MAVDYEEGRRLLEAWLSFENLPTSMAAEDAKAEIEEFLMAHAEALLNPDPWRPIEQAETDGTPYLVGWKGSHFHPMVAHCEDGVWVMLLPDMIFHPLPDQPTHFRELKGPGQ